MYSAVFTAFQYEYLYINKINKPSNKFENNHKIFRKFSENIQKIFKIKCQIFRKFSKNFHKICNIFRIFSKNIRKVENIF